MKPTEVDQLILGVGQDGGLAQVLAQLGRVVVAGHHVQRDAAPGHLLLGPDHPPVQALEHELQEYPVHRVAVLPGLVELLVGGPERVEARVPDLRLHLVELRGAEHLVAGDLPGDVAAVAGHDWHHRLAGDVTAHDQPCPLRRTWPRSGTSASRCRSRGCRRRNKWCASPGGFLRNLVPGGHRARDPAHQLGGISANVWVNRMPWCLRYSRTPM